MGGSGPTVVMDPPRVVPLQLSDFFAQTSVFDLDCAFRFKSLFKGGGQINSVQKKGKLCYCIFRNYLYIFIDHTQMLIQH